MDNLGFAQGTLIPAIDAGGTMGFVVKDSSTDDYIVRNTIVSDKNKDASEKDRGAQRRVKRRYRRNAIKKEDIVYALKYYGLLPKINNKLKEFMDKGFVRIPYSNLDFNFLRGIALREQVHPFILGKIILGFFNHRAYNSNAYYDDIGDDKENDSDFLKELDDIKELLESGKVSTPGELVYQRLYEGKGVKNLRFSRKQIAEELQKVWNFQIQKGINNLLPKDAPLNDELLYGKRGSVEIRPSKNISQKQFIKKYGHSGHEHKDHVGHVLSLVHCVGIAGLVFHQRKYYLNESKIGYCTFESGKLRCRKARRIAQEFIVRNQINNIVIIDSTTNKETPLAKSDYYDVTYNIVKNSRETKVSSLLKKLRKQGLPENCFLNFEEDVVLCGLETDKKISSKLKPKTKWENLSENEKDEIVDVLINETGEYYLDEVFETLQNKYNFTKEEVSKLLKSKLPQGRTSLSEKAMRKLLTVGKMNQGTLYYDALKKVGYDTEEEIKDKVGTYDELPLLGHRRIGVSMLDGVSNKMIQQRLATVRQEINYYLKEFGRKAFGDTCYVEGSRFPLTKEDELNKYNEQVKRNAIKNSDANKALKNITKRDGFSKDEKNRYIFWKEQKGVCPYCGEAIAESDILNGKNTEVDHVHPQRYGIDANNNKVLAHVNCNSKKGDRLPCEYFNSTDSKLTTAEAQRLIKNTNMPYLKKKRFLNDEVEDDFAPREIGNLHYINRLLYHYLRLVFPKVVFVSSREVSAFRNKLRLNTVFNDEVTDSPIYGEDDNAPLWTKNRGDLRHHCVDAMLLTLHPIKEKIFNNKKVCEKIRNKILKTIPTADVKYREDRKLRGIHKETIYDANGAVNKHVESITQSMVDKVVDPIYKKELEKISKKSNNEKHFEELLSAYAQKLQKAKRKVRIKVKKSKEVSKSLQKFGRGYIDATSQHHCVAYLLENGKSNFDFVDSVEAYRRNSNGEKLVQIKQSIDGVKIVKYKILYRGTTLYTKKGEKLVVKRLSPSNKTIKVCSIYDGRKTPKLLAHSSKKFFEECR